MARDVPDGGRKQMDALTTAQLSHLANVYPECRDVMAAGLSSRRGRRGAMTVLCDCRNHRANMMETVAFISTGNGDDLIVSFAVIDPADPTGIESLTLLRTPKYEHLLADWERGVSVSFERYVEDDEELLEEFHLDGKSAGVRLTTSLRNYELDIRKVDEREVKAMKKVLTRMNYDRRIRLIGI
jgi:hypothetical protein